MLQRLLAFVLFVCAWSMSNKKKCLSSGLSLSSALAVSVRSGNEDKEYIDVHASSSGVPLF